MTKWITHMSLEDAGHYTPEERKAIEAAYPEHEREARIRGFPTMGSGLVFPIADTTITVEPIPIPKYWRRLNGLDFGYDHPFAATSIAHDTEHDCVYVTNSYRIERSTPIIHAAAVKAWGDWIPCSWPQDGLQHDKGSGLALAAQYRAQGLNMLAEHASHEETGIGVEAGVMDMLDRMQTGRLKVFSNLSEWFAEKRQYHRKEGKIVKERDDLLCATRYALMMLRFAETEPLKRRLAAKSSGSSWAA